MARASPGSITAILTLLALKRKSMNSKKTLKIIIYETYRYMKKHAKPHRKPKQKVTTVGCMDDKKQGYEKEHHSLLTRSEIN